jgi:hypothetical protein
MYTVIGKHSVKSAEIRDYIWAKLGKSAIKLFIDKDAGLLITQIAHITRISKGSTHTIWKNLLKVGRITPRRIPHLLTSDLKKQVKCPRKLLKMFHKYDNRRFFYYCDWWWKLVSLFLHHFANVTKDFGHQRCSSTRHCNCIFNYWKVYLRWIKAFKN